MNILIDNIDDIVAKKINIEFRTDFRIAILFELLMQDSDIKKEDKLFQSLILFYPNLKEVEELGIEKAIDNILWFYKCDKEDNSKKEDDDNYIEERKQKKIYSYEYDDEYIYSAFLNQYNINLQKVKYLHWWEFKAMFNGLKDDNEIVKIMGYRAMDLSKIKDKDERKRYQKLKQYYALPDMRSEEEKETDFAESLW